MPLTIREKGDTISTFRFISVYLMEMLARWVPTTPELEAKVLFGRHLWVLAQHADALGKRTAELRLALHNSRRPAHDFMEVLKSLSEAAETDKRVDGFYRGILPVLEHLYQGYLASTDDLMDEPSVRIIERVLADLARMRGDRDAFRIERPDIALADDRWLDSLRASMSGGDFVDFRPAPA